MKFPEYTICQPNFKIVLVEITKMTPELSSNGGESDAIIPVTTCHDTYVSQMLPLLSHLSHPQVCLDSPLHVAKNLQIHMK